MTGELLLGPHAPSRQQPVAGEEPAGADQHRQGDQRSGRPADAVERRRSPRTMWPRAEDAEQGEEKADPDPEDESAPVAAERRRDPDAPSPAACEQVDRRREEGQEHRDQHDLDRPAADDALSEVDVARRALGERDALLHRVESVLRRAADLLQPPYVQRSRGVAGPARRPVAPGRDRHRRDAARDERRLLVEAEREAEIDELAQRSRPARLGAGLLNQHGACGLDESGLGRTRGVTADLEPGRPVARDGIEVHHRGDVRRLGRVRGELRRPDPAVDAAVRRQEDEGIRERQPRGAGGRRVRARKLEQRRRSRGVVVRARAGAGARVVAVGHDDDRLP